MFNDKDDRRARFARRKGKKPRDASPKDYLLGGTLYGGGGHVGGNPRYADERHTDRNTQLTIELTDAEKAKKEEEDSRHAEEEAMLAVVAEWEEDMDRRFEEVEQFDYDDYYDTFGDDPWDRQSLWEFGQELNKTEEKK